MNDFLYFLCHDCHKVLTFSEAEGTGVPAGSEIEPEYCPKCDIPSTQVDYESLKNPLHKCRCGKLILAIVRELFECELCRYSYLSMVVTIADVLTRNEIAVDAVRELPMFDHVLGCSGFHNVNVDPSVVLTYIKSVTDNN